jgi:hypothetical protein
VISGALFIGLLLGAAGGYYGGKFQNMIEQAAFGDEENMLEATQQTEEEDTTAEAYAEVETNPLDEVQTNPFE